MFSILQLMGGMLFILVAAMIFCNALEHVGEKFGLSEGLTGSIFVAVGTALPETIIPIVALFEGGAWHGVNPGEEIEVGAIMGPPLMLSTLTIALMALSVLRMRGINGVIKPEKSGLYRDLYFFIFGYGLAILLAFGHNYFTNRLVDKVVVVILAAGYFLYATLTMLASRFLVEKGYATKADEVLYLRKVFKLPSNLSMILVQASLGLTGLIYFAQVFINGITGVAKLVGLPVFLLAVVLIPVATELPEKINSILWIRKGKDTLAFANITGAMVFQGLLLPVLGILFTSWVLPLEKAVSSVVPFVAVWWLFINAKTGYKVKHFMVNGGLYLLSLLISFMVF